MSSPLLALFTRSLREDVRGRATYWTRGGLGAFLLLALLVFALSNRWTGAPGRSFFIAIISFQMLAITFIGLSYFASAVAEEKEEQTLGLLRMTDLSPVAILLGKSTSRLCGALLLLAAQFPFTIVAVTFGGVSLRQVTAVYCTLGAFTFLLCNLALLGSVLARHTTGAAVFCIITMLLLVLSGPLLGLVDQGLVKFFSFHLGLDRVADAIWTATPIARLEEVLGTGFSGSPVGWQVASNLAFGIGCFLLAWAAFQRFCDWEPETAIATPLSLPPRVVLTSVVASRRSRVPRAWSDALVWKDFYFLCGGRLGFIVRLVCYGGWLVHDGWQLVTQGSPSSVYGVGTMEYPLMPSIFNIEIAVIAARIFRAELRDQTLPALAILPGPMREIAWRKARACLFATAPGAVCSILMQILFLAFLKDASGLTSLPMRLTFVVEALAGWVYTALLVTLVAWLSLHLKRGALPVGYVLALISNALLTFFCMTAITMATFALSQGNFPFLYVSSIVVAVMNAVTTWVLYSSGVRQLELLAGES